jgi:ribonuclease HI
MVSYYAVARGRQAGIYMSWPECNAQVKGFKGAIFKKFDTQQDAERFLTSDTRGGSRSCSIGSDDIGEVEEGVLYVYTDGACINNGRPEAVAGIGVFFGEGDSRNVSQRLPTEEKQTNNVAELIAIRTAMEIVTPETRAVIVSDSQYAIGCATTYGAKCAAENWMREIPNRELVKQVYDRYQGRRETTRLVHIAAHTGAEDVHSRGNAEADRLANLGIGIEGGGCPYSLAQTSRIYLCVPFAQKDEAKSLGAKWDATRKKWYILDNCANKDQVLELFYTD